LGKIKLHEIAKKLGLASKEVVEVANKLGIEAKSHLSGIDEKDAKKVEETLLKKEKEVKVGKEKTDIKEDKKKEAKKEEKAPVIIRREVIISEEEQGTKKQEVKKEEKKNKVGFVERNQTNSDYNIVYRNKPNKPMTVSELFGLKKDSQKQEEIVEEKEIVKEEKIEKPEKSEKPKQEEVVEKEVDSKKIVTQKEENTNNYNNTNNQNSNRSNEGYNNRPNNNYNNQTGNRQGGYNNRPNNNFNNQNDNRQGGYNNRPNNNYNNQTGNRQGGYNNRPNNNFNNQNDNRQGGYNNRPNNNYNNQNDNRQGGYNNRPNNNYNNQNDNRQGGYNNRPNNNYNNQNDNRQGGYNNRPNNNFNRNNNTNQRFGNKQQGEKGLEKDIKNIISSDIVEKENVREYNRGIDKQKSNKLDENKAKKSKTRKDTGYSEFDEGKLKTLKQTNSLSNMFNDQEGGMLDYYDLSSNRGRKNKRRRNQDEKPKQKQKIFELTEIEIPESVTVKTFAAEIKKTTSDVIKKLLGFGIMATINNDIDFDTAFLIAQEFGITATKKVVETEEDILFDDSEDKEEELTTRPPVIVVMGHVDHGKTSLLDAVRKTNVIEGEAGGITQTIGAYKVKINNKEITFLDTPGHEAFTSMRSRGAKITDIAILVVAANDGVKPQTIEAINHAKSAGIPIIVAVNKMDLPDSNIEKVKQELMAYELVPEEWGGETIYVPISAKKNENIDQLLEMVLLQAEVLELKVNPKKQAKGTVIEARLDKNRGAIATMLIQRGSLDVGDTIVVGSSIGRIRNMKDDKGKSVKTAGPSTPVEIMGLTEVPEGGDTFYEVKNEKMAKHLIERRKHQAREKAINSHTKVTLDNLFSQMEEGKLKVLNLLVKADVQGSVEAVKQSLEKLSNEEVRVKVIHAGAGAVNQSDVTLAKVSNAIIIAFNVRPDNMAREIAEKEEVEIKQYSIIYQAIEDVESAMKGMLDPEFKEKVIGNAEVRQIFKISNVGTIAGAFVLQGKVERNAGIRVIRENVVIHDGKLCTLKRFKDEAKEVSKGFECGIQIEGYDDIKEGDIVEVYVMEEIKR